jgi:hypothetical protein
MGKLYRWCAVALAGGMMLAGGGCLPENFWADKAGELVNRGIFGVINAVLGAVTNGALNL